MTTQETLAERICRALGLVPADGVAKTVREILQTATDEIRSAATKAACLEFAEAEAEHCWCRRRKRCATDGAHDRRAHPKAADRGLSARGTAEGDSVAKKGTENTLVCRGWPDGTISLA